MKNMHRIFWFNLIAIVSIVTMSITTLSANISIEDADKEIVELIDLIYRYEQNLIDPKEELTPMEFTHIKTYIGTKNNDAHSLFIMGAFFFKYATLDVRYAEMAKKWFEKAAAQDYFPAQVYLGETWLNYLGDKQDLAKAEEWYIKALFNKEKPDSALADVRMTLIIYGLNSLGVTYYDKGDFANAARLYKIAADAGNIISQCNLAHCYLVGEGVDKDIHKAVELYRKSAEAGYQYAQFELGVCYQNGEGVTRSIDEALKWYAKAAAQGHKSAKRYMDEITNGSK